MTTIDRGTLRILDANLNRAREGLRVLEEFARFVRDDRALSSRLKSLRHGLAQAEDTLRSALPVPEALAAARDTAGDVGTANQTPSEQDRCDPRRVAMASCKRLQEALRVLEEYGKIVAPQAATAMEQLRYGLYDLERAALADPDRHARLRSAQLYVLITESLGSADRLTIAREAVAGGAEIIQLREKEMEDGEFLETASAMSEICRSGNCLFLLNDRTHLVELSQADGAHTGWGDLPLNLARRFVGPDRILGRSTSAPAIAQRAFEEGADYIGAGPVFPTQTKEHRTAVGLGYVRYVSSSAPLPYFCIGSINRETLPTVLEAGARSVAVCTAIINAADIAAETAWFKDQLQAAQPSGVL